MAEPTEEAAQKAAQEEQGGIDNMTMGARLYGVSFLSVGSSLFLSLAPFVPPPSTQPLPSPSPDVLSFHLLTRSK